jgi:hypothetical protein
MTSRSRARVLFFTALFALLALVPAFAGTAPAAPQGAATLQPAAAADFLASLSGTVGVPGTVAASGCTSNSQCPIGQLCCRACGYFGCDTYACFAPMNGHCPLFP